MSHDMQNDSDVLACTAASAALSLTDAPFLGPIATVRVGRVITEQGSVFVINPHRGADGLQRHRPGPFGAQGRRQH